VVKGARWWGGCSDRRKVQKGQHHPRANVRDKKGQNFELNLLCVFFFFSFFFELGKGHVQEPYRQYPRRWFCFCPIENYYLVKVCYLTLCYLTFFFFFLGQGIHLPLIKTLDCLFFLCLEHSRLSNKYIYIFFPGFFPQTLKFALIFR
jgi:hypothetical protein